MRVFIDEQGVDASEEIDEHEATAIHVVVVDQGRVVATCRLRRVGADMKLERMAVERDMRGGGVGTELLREAERIAAAEGAARMLMHAQTRARGFYASNAYDPEGELFFEAGIEHVRMTKAL